MIYGWVGSIEREELGRAKKASSPTTATISSEQTRANFDYFIVYDGGAFRLDITPVLLLVHILDSLPVHEILSTV